MKTRYTGSAVAAIATLSLVVVGIAEAQDPTGIVSQAWNAGGPIAALSALFVLAGGTAIRTLWGQLQAERRALAELHALRTTEMVAAMRDFRDHVASNTNALNRIADSFEAAARVAERRER